MPSQAGDRKSPIVGVTGHRHLPRQSINIIEHQVRERLINACPARVLSPLADGADQLVARVALDLGLPIDCPLPLPLDLYERDFASTENLHALIDTIRQRGGRVEPIELLEGLRLEDVVHDGEPRNRMYEAVGRYVTDNSDILLAIWDGNVNGKRGGTGETLRYALGQLKDPPLRVQVISVGQDV